MGLKICQSLKAASLNQEFAGSYKKKVFAVHLLKSMNESGTLLLLSLRLTLYCHNPQASSALCQSLKILIKSIRRSTPGVGNLRPAGQTQPDDTFYPARGLFSKLCIHPARNLFT